MKHTGTYSDLCSYMSFYIELLDFIVTIIWSLPILLAFAVYILYICRVNYFTLFAIVHQLLQTVMRCFHCIDLLPPLTLQDQFGVRWAIVTRTGKLRLISVWQDGDVWVLMVWLVLLVISSLITLSYHCLCTGTELVLLIHLMLMLETGVCWNDCFRRIFSDVRYMSSSVRLSVVCLSSVCRLSVVCLSVTFVHPTQPIEIFGNVSMPFDTLMTWRHPGKILRRSSKGNPSVGGVKPKRRSQI